MRHDDHTRTIGTRRGRAIGLALMVAAAIVALVYLEPDGSNTLREAGPWVARTGQQAGDQNPVGTGGSSTATGADNNSGPPAISPPPAVQDAKAALTGNSGWQELVGRRVTLTVPLGPHVNDVAFWSGTDENRVLVVLARDQRDGATRQRGERSPADLQARQEAAVVSGTIQRLPHAEAMYSWKLTNHDAAELARRPIYLHVDDVQPAVAGGGD